MSSEKKFMLFSCPRGCSYCRGNGNGENGGTTDHRPETKDHGNCRYHWGWRLPVRDESAAPEFFGWTAQHADVVRQREVWLSSEPDIYSACLPGCEGAIRETVAIAAQWGTIDAGMTSADAAAETASGACRWLGTIWEPDFLLLTRDHAGTFRLAGGCVCFPSSWSLSEKISQPLLSIHGPVPGLNAQIGRSIDAFLSKLSPGDAWLRHNWGLAASPELNQHPHRRLPRLTDTMPAQEIWLRVEHQALIALPKSGAVLFGIRIEMVPLAAVIRDRVARERLAHALATMPDEVARYKGLADGRQRITDLLTT